MKHTPGPWRVLEEPGDKLGNYPKQIRRWIIDSESRKCMAILEAYKFEDDPDVWEEVRANAQLIAAAPDLLKALEEIVNWPEGGNRYGQDNIQKFAARAIRKII